jgi:putative transposase
VVRYPRWDLTLVDLVEPRDGTILARLFPLDRAANADGRRAVLDPRPEAAASTASSESPAELPPLLKQILAEYSATGLPPAYLPKNASAKQAEQGGAA